MNKDRKQHIVNNPLRRRGFIKRPGIILTEENSSVGFLLSSLSLQQRRYPPGIAKRVNHTAAAAIILIDRGHYNGCTVIQS